MNYKRISLVLIFISALIMFLFFFFLIKSFAQVELLGTVTVDTVKYDYWSKLEPLLKKHVFDKKQDGSTILFIPLYKVYGDTTVAVLLDGFEFYPYRYNSKTEKVDLVTPKETAVIEYNLKSHKYEKKKYKHDNFNDFKEKDEKKIKDKIKEKEKKKPTVTPGNIKPKGKQL